MNANGKHDIQATLQVGCESTRKTFEAAVDRERDHQYEGCHVTRSTLCDFVEFIMWVNYYLLLVAAVFRVMCFINYNVAIYHFTETSLLTCVVLQQPVLCICFKLILQITITCTSARLIDLL